MYRSRLKGITQRKICKGSLLNGTKAMVSGLQVKYMMMGVPKKRRNRDVHKQSIEKKTQGKKSASKLWFFPVFWNWRGWVTEPEIEFYWIPRFSFLANRYMSYYMFIIPLLPLEQSLLRSPS